MNNSLVSNNDENCFLHTNETTQLKRTVRNKSTQVKARQCKSNDKKQVKSTVMLKLLAKDSVAKLITHVCFLSVGTRTEDASLLNESNYSNLLLPSNGTISMPEDTQSMSPIIWTNSSVTILDLIVKTPQAIGTKTMFTTIIESQNLKKLTRVQTKVKLF